MPNKLADLVQPMQPGLLGAVKDPQFRGDVVNGLLGAVNRGAIANLLGGPVDMAALALAPVGYNDPAPVGGSEWICQQMERLGMVPKERNHLAEQLASFAVPLVGSALPRGPVVRR